MQPIKYKAIIYIRLSSADDKQGESDSVVNQRKLINEWLKSHPEIEVVAEKVDDGWSGILFDRPAFKEMMEEIEAGRVNCCICKDAYGKSALRFLQVIILCMEVNCTPYGSRKIPRMVVKSPVW